MAMIKRFEEIIAWRKARVLNTRLGSIIDGGRFKRDFRLIGQIEGSAGSVMDNIAEGFERSGNKEFVQFLYVAKGSCGELRSQLYRAIDRNYITEQEFDELYKMAVEVIVMIQSFIDYLEQSELRGNKYKHRK